MQQTATIAVIGGAGKAGKYLLQHLIQQGFHCKALLRHPQPHHFENPAIEVIQGDAREYRSVEALANGCAAVVSCLGQAAGEAPIFSSATKNVIDASRQHNINRYIVASGLSVNTPADKKGVKALFATDWMYKNYPATTHDKQVEYEMLANTDLDWTLLRLPLIIQTDDKPGIAVNLEDCPGDGISATSLAHFISGQIFSNVYTRQAPFIANK